MTFDQWWEQPDPAGDFTDRELARAAWNAAVETCAEINDAHVRKIGTIPEGALDSFTLETWAEAAGIVLARKIRKAKSP